jgi:glutamate-1-semialdehyde 2,1-aminomutase
MTIIAIVQARMGSVRLPNKVMKRVVGIPLIELLLGRLRQSVTIDEIIVATSHDKRNRLLTEHVRNLGYKCECGSENDVLERYFQVAKKYKADTIVRITGDCPLIDPVLVDQVIDKFKKDKVDYCSNIDPPTFPDGLDIEVFTYAALERAHLEAVELFDREHVTPYLRLSGEFNTSSILNTQDLSKLRWTVDDSYDLTVITNVYEYFSPRQNFSWHEILQLQKEKSHLFSINQHLSRNAGATMTSGIKLWNRARQIIPGGNMLLSKRPEMFLPGHWPTYFSKAKGCKVWDLDGTEYIDMSLMGVGTNTLGYGHPEVDDAVLRTIGSGNMSTLNCPEEVELAERLLALHPWADMARFARTGGEANAIAIRIARAAVGKDKVAICGYHGWHDWYLSANLNDDSSLDGHLLPGLQPNGVPRELRGLVFPFAYNNFTELEILVDTHDIGVIKMEVVRNVGPSDSFLQKIRNLATERGIVLIFDECTSGFRETLGGLHKKYDVQPDMAIFGKTMGNGYAITAIIGKQSVMEAAQSTFISSTFWTERIGPSAALATIEIMERLKSWEIITKVGLDIKTRWQKLADKYELEINHWGLSSLAGFSFKAADALAYKTLISQEMLKKGYLAGTSVYACIDHTPDVVSAFFEALDPVFSTVKECERGRNIIGLLEGPICHNGFKRLN